MTNVEVQNISFGPRDSFPIICGPCVIEGEEACRAIAQQLKELSVKLNLSLIFKASYDKANRTSVDAFRGPGLDKGLAILKAISDDFDLPVLTDVHSPEQALKAGKVVDIIQIPAFMARQTDLVVAAGESGAVVNIKKPQFLSPQDMIHIIKKVESTGNKKILLTERGSTFGYGHLVADMKGLQIMRELGYPVVFDATHSVQRPSAGEGGFTPGDGKWAPHLARAAVAAGCEGLFIETHLNPAEAKSDKENAVPFKELEALLIQIVQINEIVKK